MARDEVLGVARAVDPTALPRRSEELLPEGLDQAAMVVADDEPDTGQAALDERADERRPGRSLVVARGELEAEDPALPALGHPGRHERRHRHDPTTLADLDVRGVQPEIGIRLVAELPLTEGLDLGVERGADPADLALADRGDAERVDEILDPAGRHAQDIRLLDDREEGPLGAPPGLEQAREIRAVADPRDRQLKGAHPGVPAPIAVPVPTGQPVLRVA